MTGRTAATAAIAALTTVLIMAQAAFAGGALPPDLALASSAFAQRVDSAGDGIGALIPSRLAKMTGIPAELSSLPADKASQPGLVRLEQEARADAKLMLDPALASSLEFTPLGVKVEGEDAFAAVSSAATGDALVKVTCGQLSVIGTPSKAGLDSVPMAELSEYTKEEVAALDSMDKARYALSATDLRTTIDVEPSVIIESACPPLLLEDGTLSADAEALHKQALAYVRSVVADKSATRLHWRVKELPFGVYGESILSFRPPSGPEYAQHITSGYSIRYATDGELFSVSINRHPDIFPKDRLPKSPLSLRTKSANWFSSAGEME